MFNLFANWIIKRSLKTPYIHLAGYMERYWVFNSYEGETYKKYGLFRRLPSARVHRILRSDDDRVFHDHPWSYLTIILKGGYWEVRPQFDKSGIYIRDDRRWHGPGSVLFRSAKSWHRLELPEGQTAWTLFITGRYQQGWGFLTSPSFKTPYRAYLAAKSQSPKE